MASEKPISSDFECGICSDMYKDPKILDCQHTFCLQCLQDYIAKTNSRSCRVPCPVCRRKTKLPDAGARGLKTSLYMVSLMEDLARQRQEKMDSSQLGPRFKQGQGVDDTNLGELVTPRRWELCREFGECAREPGTLCYARHIAAGRHDEIAVTDTYNKLRVQIFGVDGTYKCQIQVDATDVTASVAFAKQRNRLIVVFHDCVKVFNQDNSLAFQFSTGSQYARLSCVAVREDGNILVGDTYRNVVTEHRPTGVLKRTIPLPSRDMFPWFLAARINGGLIISGAGQQVVYVTDGHGDTLFRIEPTIGGQPVEDCLGVWSDHFGIYITVSIGLGNGHIHQYDAQGAFLACIVQGLHCPDGITMTPAGQLAVADSHSVKIYH